MSKTAYHFTVNLHSAGWRSGHWPTLRLLTLWLSAVPAGWLAMLTAAAGLCRRAGNAIERDVGELVMHLLNHQTHHRGQVLAGKSKSLHTA